SSSSDFFASSVPSHSRTNTTPKRRSGQLYISRTVPSLYSFQACFTSASRKGFIFSGDVSGSTLAIARIFISLLQFRVGSRRLRGISHGPGNAVATIHLRDRGHVLVVDVEAEDVGVLPNAVGALALR